MYNTRNKTYTVPPEAYKDCGASAFANPPLPLKTRSGVRGCVVPFLEALRLKGSQRGFAVEDPVSTGHILFGSQRRCVLENLRNPESTAYSGGNTRLDGRF